VDGRRARLAALLLAGILAAGCTSGDGEQPRGAAPATVAAATETTSAVPAASSCDATGSGTPVQVELKEWSVAPTPASVAAGRVRFELTNAGEQAHELVVAEAPTPSALPSAADGTVAEAALPAGAIAGKVAPLKPGRTCTARFRLAKGTYALFCNIVGRSSGAPESHFRKGMVAVLNVT
jgi:uncharacterized cupredoxin-like copper-binding protein